MKAIGFFIAWGYIDFSLWLCFPQTQEEERQLQTDAWIAQTFPWRKDPKTDTWQDGATKDTRWKAAVLEEWHKPVERLFLPPAQLLGGGHLFLARRDFWSFCIGIHFLHLQRPWKGMSNSSICVYVSVWLCVCGCLTYFCCTDMRLAFLPHKYKWRHGHKVVVERANVLAHVKA